MIRYRDVTAAKRHPSRLDIVHELQALGEGDPRILALYLFGSRSRQEETDQSDVDVGVLFRQTQTLRDVLILEDAIEQRLGLPLDLVDAGRASAFLALDIIRGDRVFCADGGRCDEFELYVMRRAGDLAPFERERRRLLLQP
jgi:predicted nucleotidyltransferase